MVDKLVDNLKNKLPIFYHDNMQELCLYPNDKIQSMKEQILTLKQTKAKLKAEQLADLDNLHSKYQNSMAEERKLHEEELSKERSELQALKDEINALSISQSEQLENLKQSLQEEFEQKEANFDITLKEEFRRYFELKEDMEEMRVRFDKEFTSILIAHENKLKELEQVYTQQMNSVKESYSEILADMNGFTSRNENALEEMERKHEVEIHKIEEGKEIEALKEQKHAEQVNKGANEKKKTKTELKEERERVEKIKNEREKHFKELSHEAEILRNKLVKTEEQLKERNDVITRKDNTIKELRSFNIHLMNFHFVLNQKIGALKEDREPLDTQIKEKEDNIRQMYNELIGEFNDNKAGAEKNKKIKSKITAVEQLNNELKKQIFESSKKLIIIQSDLANLIRTTDISHLLPNLQKLMSKYRKTEQTELQNFTEINSHNIRDTLVEANMQKAYNEVLQYHSSIKEKLSAMERHLKRNQKEKSESLFRKMKENAFLIRECNVLRNEKHNLVKDVIQLEKQYNEMVNSQGSVVSKNSKSMASLKETGDYQNIIQGLEANKHKINQQTKALKHLEKQFRSLAND